MLLRSFQRQTVALAAPAAVAAALLAGCGRNSGEMPRAVAPAAPRKLEVSAQARPLVVTESGPGSPQDAFPARFVSTSANYDAGSAPPSGASIAPAAGPIREPSPASLLPPVTAAQAPIAAPRPPHLAQTPNFGPPPIREPSPSAPPVARTASRAGTFVLPETKTPQPAPSAAPSVSTSAMPTPAAAPLALRPNPALLAPTLAQAAQRADRGFAMAQRGMLFAGREELIDSLRMVAQGLDAQAGTAAHASALAAGLTALDEARDFQSAGSPGLQSDARQVARGHRTPVLQQAAAPVPALAAQQQYLSFAQSQLAAAVGGQRVGSLALFRLGKVETALSRHADDQRGLHGPQAIAFHQAALDVDATNHLAANELGVLLARYGQLHEAKRLLVHSVSVQPHVEGWHNLAVVHRQLGETDLAAKADHERQLLAKGTSGRAKAGDDLVRWVDRRTFAASTPGDVSWTPNAASQAASSPAATERR